MNTAWFKHLFIPGNEALLAQFQKQVNDDGENLRKLQDMSKMQGS